eukprot:337532_1
MSYFAWIVYNVVFVVVYGSHDLKFETSPFVKTLSASDHTVFKKKIDEFYTNWQLHKTVGDDTYEYIFEWNCFCATCLELPKYIHVKEDKIVSIKFSDQLSYDYYNNENHMSPKTKTQFDLKIPNYGCDNLYLHSKHYHNIEGLFHILQQSLHPNYYDPNRHIISMTFDEKLSYPKTVYISNDLHELGWSIKCLSMSNDSDSACSNAKQYPFWIEKKWQEIIATLMILLVLFWSCVGWIIACLKKRARALQRKAVRSRGRGAKRNAQSGNQNKNVRPNPAAHNLRQRGAHNRSGIIEESGDDAMQPGSS